MLSDRSYMRAPTTERGTSPLVWLISSVIAAFVLQLFFSRECALRGIIVNAGKAYAKEKGGWGRIDEKVTV